MLDDKRKAPLAARLFMTLMVTAALFVTALGNSRS